MYLTGLVLRCCLIASTLAVPAREMANTQVVEADEEMDDALWPEPAAVGGGPRDVSVPVETRTAPTETVYAGTSPSIELETSTLPTETVYAPTTPTSTKTPTSTPLGDLNENPDNKNTEPIIGNPQDPNNNAISPYRPHEAALPTSIPPDRVSVTLGVPTHTLYPNGTEFKQVKWLNYCHAHRRPLFYTFRVVGQLWGGKNMTASRFWNVVNTCGQQSGNYFIDAESKSPDLSRASERWQAYRDFSRWQ